MKKKILIIEDEPILRDMYIHKFEQEGFNVVFAVDGEEGFSKAKEEKPDLILLDILMPKNNGLELLEKMRGDKDISETKVVAFSNFDDPKTRLAASNLKVVDYIIKTNLTPGEVVEKVKKHLV